MSGERIQCAPRSNGTLKLRVSVKQRPPMRLVASIQDRLGAELLVSDIFDTPTVAELDQQIEKALQQSPAAGARLEMG